jgi:uncharacterized protein
MMKRKAFLAGTTGALAAGTMGLPAISAESQVSVQVPGGTLYGTLTLTKNTPGPIALIIAGSGPTDRNGNSGLDLKTNSYELLAAALASKGVASLRYDKRGVGMSVAAASSENELRFETFVSDAIAWIDMLLADKRFSKIVVCGHSEGSLIGILALQRRKGSDFASLEGAGRPAYTVLREQLKPKMPPELYAQADTTISALQRGQLAPNPPPELTMLFRPSVQPYLISWFKYDPAVEIAKLTIPVTIVQGTADIQVTMADADALKQGQPRAQLVVVGGMNHVLKYAPDTSSMQVIMKGYTDPTLPIDPRVVTAIGSLVLDE